MKVACEECDGVEFKDLESFWQVTGDMDSPSLEVTVGTCVMCGEQNIVETRVV